jgi:hypothetical protein
MFYSIQPARFFGTKKNNRPMRIIPHHFFLEFIVFFFNLFIVCSTFVCPSPGSTLYITLIHREHRGT